MGDVKLPPGIGVEWYNSSWVWGERCGSGAAYEQRSPADRSVIQRVCLLDERELAALVAMDGALPRLDPAERPRFCLRLGDELHAFTGPPLEAMRSETAFVRADAEEMLQGTLAYVRAFAASWEQCQRPLIPVPPYPLGPTVRQIRLVPSPWGTVVVILPQNAFLILAVTTLLNALAAGNRVILRAPLQSARSAALLSVRPQTRHLAVHH